jgi:hypothetical protein
LQRTSGAGSKGGLLGRLPGSSNTTPIESSWPTQDAWPTEATGYESFGTSEEYLNQPTWTTDQWLEPQAQPTEQQPRRLFPRLLPQTNRPQWSPRL